MEALTVSGGLGNLAQSARKSQLKTARTILYFIGVLTVVVNLGFVYFAANLVDSEFEKELKDLRGQGMEIDEVALTELRGQAIRSVQLVNGIGAGIGFIFLVCGALVYKYPVPTTIISLVLYIGAAAVYGVIDPTTLVRGWIVKILIVVGLFKAVQAALAYENERKQAVDTGGEDFGVAV